MCAPMTRLAAAALAAFLWADTAHAHSFFDAFCCNQKDCTEVPPGSLTENEHGVMADYISPITGRRIRGQIYRGSLGDKKSPDGKEYACELNSIPAPRCTYLPIPTM